MPKLSPSANSIHQNPIGVYDSGVGGLTVLNSIRQLLPHENLIYVADSGHLPYGQKSSEYVTDRALKIVDYFFSQGAKAVAIPCNTATAAAIRVLRERFPQTPFVGIEPAIKPAARMTKSGVIGVLATTGTLLSQTFTELVKREAPNTKVLLKPCPGWVDLVEKGELSGEKVNKVVGEPLNDLLENDADVLVLGCTHFPFLLPAIRDFVGDDYPVLETGQPFARQLHFQLDKNQLLNREGQVGYFKMLTSGDTKRVGALTSKLIGEQVSVQKLPDAFC